MNSILNNYNYFNYYLYISINKGKLRIMETINLLTTEQLSHHLQVSSQTVKLWRNEGMPVYINSGRTLRYKLNDVIEWLNNRGENGRKSRLDKTT